MTSPAERLCLQWIVVFVILALGAAVRADPDARVVALDASDDKQVVAVNRLYRMGRYDEALKGYRSLVAERPRLVAAWVNLGAAHLMLQEKGDKSLPNLDATVEAFERAVELAPDHPFAASHLGAAYRSAGRAGDAVITFERLASERPSNATMLLELGRAHAHLGNQSGAVDAFERALKLRLDDAVRGEVQYLIGVAWHRWLQTNPRAPGPERLHAASAGIAAMQEAVRMYRGKDGHAAALSYLSLLYRLRAAEQAPGADRDADLALAKRFHEQATQVAKPGAPAK